MPSCIKIFKFSLLSCFVLACTLTTIFAVYLRLSPLLSSPSCSLDCDYRNQTTLDHYKKSKSVTDFENICIPCVFAPPTAIFLILSTLLLCVAFIIGFFHTAFDDPGYLSPAPNASSETQQNEDDERDDHEMMDRQRRVAESNSSHQNNINTNNNVPLKFQWQTSSGKSKVMAWEGGMDHVEEESSIDNNNNNNGNACTTIGVKPRVKYCQTCGIYRPPRAAHSRKTHRCVKDFDHFCAVTHSDIGKGNIWSFRLMVFSITSLALFILSSTGYCYGFLVTRIPPALETNFKNYQAAEALSLTMIVICSFAILPLIAFSLFYLRLWICLGGMTWREYVKKGTVFISHDFATQFDDPCSNFVRSFHCGKGGTCGEIVGCSCGLCFLFGYGADEEGPTCWPNKVWNFCCSSDEKKWMRLSSIHQDTSSTTITAIDPDAGYDPENPVRTESYLIIPRPVML